MDKKFSIKESQNTINTYWLVQDDRTFIAEIQDVSNWHAQWIADACNEKFIKDGIKKPLKKTRMI